MIVGIGTDIIEMERVRKALTAAFLKRYYTTEEWNMLVPNCDTSAKLEEMLKKPAVVSKAAGNFAAKEAFSKALKVGFTNGVKLEEISVLRKESGCPYIVLHGQTKQFAKKLGVKQIHVSISNTKMYAQAFVVCETDL